MKIAAVVVLATVFTTPALAQIQLPMQSEKPALTPDEQAKQDRLDSAYKAAVQSRPEQKVTDPWGNVRSAPEVKAAKPAKPKQP
jgi:hypothetical protein